ncbi:fatty acid-binding protein 2-like [Anticarsia gemmatalis]|uniref:fatty acid-binding protein 2-like n=1 Tax=Anticarsia gemmatalis TaxID=129554 RepID=UPI003F75C475
MSFLGKEYHFVSQENVDGFLKFVGVPEDKIEEMSKFAPEIKFVKDGDSYTVHSRGASGPTVTTFKSGVEFDDAIGPEKRPVKTTYVVDGNTVTQTINDGKRTGVFKREYNGDDLLLTMTLSGWDGVAKRHYKA